MRTAYEHCEQLVRDADKDRFLASLFAPAGRRPGLHALYAFDIELGRVRALARQPLPGEIRLQWWRDVLAGERGQEAAANPVAAALLATIDDRGLPRELLREAVDARTFDLYDTPMHTCGQLEEYCKHTLGNILASAAYSLDLDVDVSEQVAHAAVAVAVTGLLRDFPLHASRHQLYVPMDLLERHGVLAEDIFAGRTSAGLLAALADLRGLARKHVRASDSLAALGSSAALPSTLPVALAPLYLDRMERQGYDPFHTPVDVPQWRRQWTLWRAARRSAGRHSSLLTC